MTEDDFHSLFNSVAESNEQHSENKPTQQLVSWSLSDFINEFGKMKVGEFINRETGDNFQSCVFTKGHIRTYVAFSSKLGVLTSEEISKMKEQLIVVQLPSGRYSLTKVKKSTLKDVNV